MSDRQQLSAAEVSLFCESMATMISAGIQTDEALSMLHIERQNTALSKVSEHAYVRVAQGCSLHEALEETDAFPKHALDMIKVGEQTGRLEHTLRSLMLYYEEENRIFTKLRTAVGYPAALLCVMCVIVAFAVWVVLPVFIDVYASMAGGLTLESTGSVAASVVIGWVALAITLISAVVSIVTVVASRTPKGNARIIKVLERMPFSKSAMQNLAVSRFTLVLSTYLASGVSEEEALDAALSTIEHTQVYEQASAARDLLASADYSYSLATALADSNMLDPLYGRLLLIGSRSGSLTEALAGIGQNCFNEAAEEIDQIIDSVEPVFAALLTIAVGATLIAVMLPLIGIMGSIG